MGHSVKKHKPNNSVLKTCCWLGTWPERRQYPDCTSHLGSGQELKFKRGLNMNLFLVQVRGFTV